MMTLARRRSAPAQIPMVRTSWAGHDWSRESPCDSMVFTFSDLEQAVSMLLYPQDDSEAVVIGGAVPANPHVEIHEFAHARKADIAQITGVVCRAALRRLVAHIDAVQLARNPVGGDGLIHWRTRPEFETGINPVIIRYQDDGPDTDPLTGWQCVMDHNWHYVGVYMRLRFEPTTAQSNE